MIKKIINILIILHEKMSMNSAHLNNHKVYVMQENHKEIDNYLCH